MGYFSRPYGTVFQPVPLYPGFHPGLLSVVPTPDFLRPLVDTNEPHAAFLDESRTRSRGIGQLTGNQGTGLGPAYSLSSAVPLGVVDETNVLLLCRRL